jgi:hypothetical protein
MFTILDLKKDLSIGVVISENSMRPIAVLGFVANQTVPRPRYSISFTFIYRMGVTTLASTVTIESLVEGLANQEDFRVVPLINTILHLARY